MSCGADWPVAPPLAGARCGLTGALIREGEVLSLGFIDIGPLADAVAGFSGGMGDAGGRLVGSDVAWAAADPTG